MHLHKAIKKLENGQTVKISVTDPGFTRDVEAWCKKTGNTLVERNTSKNNIEAIIVKGYLSEVN